MKLRVLVLALASVAAPSTVVAADDFCSRLILQAVQQFCQLLPSGLNLCQPVAVMGPGPECKSPEKQALVRVPLAAPTLQFPYGAPASVPNFSASPPPYAAPTSPLLAALPPTSLPYAADIPVAPASPLVAPVEMVQAAPPVPPAYQQMVQTGPAALPPTSHPYAADIPVVPASPLVAPVEMVQAEPPVPPANQQVVQTGPAALPPTSQPYAADIPVPVVPASPLVAPVEMVQAEPPVPPANQQVVQTGPAALPPTSLPYAAAAPAPVVTVTAPAAAPLAAEVAPPAVAVLPARSELAQAQPEAPATVAADTSADQAAPAADVAAPAMPVPAASAVEVVAPTLKADDVSAVAATPVPQPAAVTPLVAAGADHIAPAIPTTEPPAAPQAASPALAVAEVTPEVAPAAVTHPQTSASTRDIDALAHFDFDSAELTKAGRNALDAWIALAPKRKTVRITGYADRLGPEPYNLKLSLRRAQAVKAYLAGKGINGRVVQLEARGEADPVIRCKGGSNPVTKACLAPNRRAQVELE